MVKFPEKGLGKYEVLDSWIAFEKESAFDRFRKNFADGCILTSTSDIPWGDEVRHLVDEAYLRFMHFKHWFTPGVMRMHDEAVSMVAEFLNLKDGNAPGNLTGGGSESNFCAMFTAKSQALATGKIKPGHRPSIVLPKTAHYSFFKGCHLFDLTPIIVEPIPGTIYKIDPEDMRKAVREDTIAIVASAGSFPFGTVEPIEAVGEIAQEKGLYFHVDACFGGFLLPFLERGGYNIEIPKWDFRVKGVSSISADFHKGGMVAPTVSCIVYRSEELLDYARKIARPRGCLSGTIGCGPVAAAWTMLNLAAAEGYITIAKNIMELQEAILEGARQLGLNTIPESKVNVNVIYSNEYDLMPTVEGLRNDGWILRTTTSFPPIGITVSVRLQSDGQIEAFLNDLRKNMKLAEPIKSKAEMKVYGPEYPMIY